MQPASSETDTIDISTPQRPDGLGLSQSLMEDLVLRRAVAEGRTPMTTIAEKLHVSINVVESLLNDLRHRKLIEYDGMEGRAYLISVTEAGHELGVHGYSHETPIAMTREQETEVLDKCIDLVTKLSGKRPTGYVAPWWEFSNVTNELLLERGIKYDHSLMHNDFTPYYVRVGDSWTKIDYSKKPSDWMIPLKRGHETDLIEIPASWYLDDLPPMMFIKTAPNSHGFVNPRHLEEMWRDQFDWVYREMDYAVFPITIHPDVSGRPQVLMMLERLYAHMIRHPGVKFVTMDEIADDFAKRFPRKK